MGAFDLIRGWPAPAATAGVTDPRTTLAAAGDVERALPWASVTKLVTAFAVLQLVETGDVDLDQPAGPPASTVRHLLAHAGGLPFDGERTVAAPGRRRLYSNTGFDLLGQLVGDRVGRSFGEHVRTAVFDPLAMTGSAIEGSPSAGGTGPLVDLLAFGRELLAPTLLDPDTLAMATTVVFPGLTGVLPGFGRQDPNDWGLGFELRDSKRPHWTGTANSPETFGHFGQTGSFLWVDPHAGLACAALTGVDFGPWAVQAWPAFSDAVLAEFGDPARVSPPDR